MDTVSKSEPISVSNKQFDTINTIIKSKCLQHIDMDSKDNSNQYNTIVRHCIDYINIVHIALDPNLYKSHSVVTI